MNARATDRQLFVLARLAAIIASTGTAPSIKALAHACGCRSVRTIWEHVDGLRRRGLVVCAYVAREPMRPQIAVPGTMRVTDAGHDALREHYVGVPG